MLLVDNPNSVGILLSSFGGWHHQLPAKIVRSVGENTVTTPLDAVLTLHELRCRLHLLRRQTGVRFASILQNRSL